MQEENSASRRYKPFCLLDTHFRFRVAYRQQSSPLPAMSHADACAPAFGSHILCFSSPAGAANEYILAQSNTAKQMKAKHNHGTRRNHVTGMKTNENKPIIPNWIPMRSAQIRGVLP